MRTSKWLHISERVLVTLRPSNLANLVIPHSPGQLAMESRIGTGSNNLRMQSFSADSTSVWVVFSLWLPARRFYQVINRGVIVAHMRTHWRVAYDWKSLPVNALVVDVGGGIGTASIALAKEFSNLNIVIQDRLPVVEEGIEVRLLLSVSHL